MVNLAATNRCILFEEIAEHVWKHVIHNHSASMDVSEIGVTKDIISSIRNHANRIPNFGVWANPGYNEDENGSDLDVFVETTTGQFVWYALQAKALRQNGRYQDMAGIRGGDYQWDKLNRLAQQGGCISRYLLYNGVSSYKHSGNDKCNRIFNEPQFGCSLVETSKVQHFALLRNPKFEDFHPANARPWRTILCCLHDLGQATLFSGLQIKRALDYYQTQVDVTNISQEERNDNAERLNDLGANAINNISEGAGWTPYYRVVIRTTAGLTSGPRK